MQKSEKSRNTNFTCPSAGSGFTSEILFFQQEIILQDGVCFVFSNYGYVTLSKMQLDIDIEPTFRFADTPLGVTLQSYAPGEVTCCP